MITVKIGGMMSDTYLIGTAFISSNPAATLFLMLFMIPSISDGVTGVGAT